MIGIEASFLIPLYWFICSSVLQTALSLGSLVPGTRIVFNTRYCTWQCLARRDPSLEEGEEGEEDAEEASAYGNRSLSWTNRYRKLLPYELVRKSVVRLGLRSREEWDEYLADGKEALGPYVPNRPDEMYVEDWVSWEEFLGVIRPYEEVKYIVQNVLKLRSMDEYKAFVNTNSERAEGLRIPLAPEKFYRDEWISAEHFFGTWG